MADDVHVVGTYQVTEQTRSPEWEFGEQTTCKRVYEGPYEECLNARPVRGQTMSDTGTLRVNTSQVVRLEAGNGRLTIYLAAPPTEEAQQEKYHVDWIETELPIQQNPAYAAITAVELIDVERWRDEPNPELKAVFKYETLAGEKELEGLALAIAQKMIKGVESYREWHPVCRITGILSSLVQVQKCGVWKTSSPFSGTPAGYKWMKTADRRLRNKRTGFWERSEEWTGYKTIDPDLYEAGS